MAGQTDSVPQGRAGMPEIQVDDPFDRMAGIMGRILDALTNRSDETIWRLTDDGSVIHSQHVRFRSSALVFAVDAAATITLTIGTVTWRFTVGAAETRAMPFPFVFDRAMDVSIAASAGTFLTAYLIGSPE